MIYDAQQKKINGSATARRFRVCIAFTGIAAALFLLAGGLCAGFLDGGAAIAWGIVCFLFAAAFVVWGGVYVRDLRRLIKRANRYRFALTESASFECFGLFLAMNVTFRDQKGILREGRTRFLFRARDVEAWQNVSLEIGYKGADERIILIGGAPGRDASVNKKGKNR